MIVLAIDTSHAIGSAAAARDGVVVAHERFGEQDSHVREIGSVVDRLLERSSLAVGDIELLALVSGPGSFTGLRIGMSFAKGLVAALGVPVVTMNALELLALPHIDAQALVLPMIDARKAEVYAALYERSNAEEGPSYRAVLGPKVEAPGAFLETLENSALGRRASGHGAAAQGTGGGIFLTGSGSVRYRAVIEDILGTRAAFAGADALMPSTALLAVRAASLPPLTKEEILALEPFYIRSSGAELKRLREVNADG
jgi:tRNA threonylcarbamoyladenosine biosynthesis protein TsaB